MKLSLCVLGLTASFSGAVNPTSETAAQTVTYVTIPTSFSPTKTDQYGAISTHRVTSTRQFDPSAFTANPSDACHGGVIIFNVAGNKTSVLKIGYTLAKIAALSHTNVNDYHVYDANLDVMNWQTSLTSLVCSQSAFDKTIQSIENNAGLWALIGFGCNQIVYPDGSKGTVCASCDPGHFLLETTHQCYPCTSVSGCTQAFIQCTNPANSKCGSCVKRPVENCKSLDYVVCDDKTGKSKCDIGGCNDGYYTDETSGQCFACVDADHCQPGFSLCTSGAAENYCQANRCMPGYFNDPALGGPCDVCTSIANCKVLTCTTNTNSVCSECDDGYTTANKGTMCIPI
eukprot:comp8420_c0_seq1/m.3776 comp8420_c0_seq1/g.3776  ORF comp8420_c0_seq1/g.3776 comp8420_c0_seq1/m.3776 type:complete len:343 (-) comp8420_c0_seq1:163-1191(-)